MKCFPTEKVGGRQPKTTYRKTYLDDIIDFENREKRPGPGNYFRKGRNTEEDIKHHAGASVERGTYLDEVEYLAAESPGIGEYNIATRLTRKSFNMSKPHNRMTKQSTKKPGRRSLQTLNPMLEGTFDFIGRSKRKRNTTFSKDKRFKVDCEQARVPSPQHYTLKRVWSANPTDHFAKQVSSLQAASIYH